MRALTADYETFGEIGEINPFKAELSGNWPVTHGRLLHPKGTARTATGVGTAFQVGALLATKRMYCTLHVLSISGTATPTITVRLESDNAVGFPSAVTQTTFTAMTAIGSQTATVAGALTDDWWRPAWTITGTNPSFLFVVAVGIGPL